jgi:hypothetical protein
MLVAMMVPAIYTSALIFGPAFLIVLALCMALLIRFPSRRSWIGAAMVAIGFIEFSLVPVWVLWIFFIGFSTSVIGVALLGIALFSHRKSSVAGIVFVVLGVLGLLAFSFGFWAGNFGIFVFWIVVLVFGTAGAAILLPEQQRAKIGLVVMAVGFAMILVAVFTGYLALAFFVGLIVVLAGLSVVFSGLRYWTANRAGGNTLGRLKKALYVLLAVVVVSSAVVFSLRATHAIREELYENWSLRTTASTKVRGVVTGIYLNYDVENYGYSYHVFPALIIVNVTEVVEAGSSWRDLTEESEHWMNENMTVAYDKPDVPSLTVGQRVEASGYYDLPVEDTSSYSFKLVVDAKIEGSYVTPLQG